LVDDKDQKKIENICSFSVLFAEIPRIKGSVDGLQGGVNEARNRAMETQQIVSSQTVKFIESLRFITKKLLAG